jgi:poly-beta-1,6-N-acetyl-D-glucosamine synthase
MLWLWVIPILPYFFLLLWIYRALLKIRYFNPTSTPSAFVSVIVACRNEQENLPMLLADLSAQDYPAELYEVIIVDDHSTDQTLVTAAGKGISFRCQILQNTGIGKKDAIRTGINASSGKLIIMTDADCSMGPLWVKTIASFFEEINPDLIIGPVQLQNHPGIFGRFQELEYLSLQGITAGTSITGNPIMCNGANLAFRKDIYNEHVKNLRFELGSGDDVFLLHSIKKDVRSKICWLESADAVVTTATSPDIASFYRQRSRWISKWKAYDDRFTIITGIITFTAVMLQLILLVSALFIPALTEVFAVVFLIKSVPDFLILMNTTARYGKSNLMYWFFSLQVVYPLYVAGVALLTLIPGPGKTINSPFQKGT